MVWISTVILPRHRSRVTNNRILIPHKTSAAGNFVMCLWGECGNCKRWVIHSLGWFMKYQKCNEGLEMQCSVGTRSFIRICGKATNNTFTIQYLLCDVMVERTWSRNTLDCKISFYVEIIQAEGVVQAQENDFCKTKLRCRGESSGSSVQNNSVGESKNSLDVQMKIQPYAEKPGRSRTRFHAKYAFWRAESQQGQGSKNNTVGAR
jgi:hypothetical protein